MLHVIFDDNFNCLACEDTTENDDCLLTERFIKVTIFNPNRYGFKFPVHSQTYCSSQTMFVSVTNPNLNKTTICPCLQDTNQSE